MADPQFESPDKSLAAGFASQIARWAQGDASSLRVLKLAARELSLAISAGHVCVGLAELLAIPGMPADADALRQLLLAAGVVGTPQAPGAIPLILDPDGRLYLHRHFDYEQRLARRLLRAARPLGRPVDPELPRRLDTLFAANAPALAGKADWQKLAAALAMRNGLTIISGGPGTGKTTTVVNLLACLIAQEPACRIALAAPTGKAAARMTEAIGLRAAHLPQATRERLPAEAYTIHRLLGASPSGFRHDAAHPLAIDALVVDEASMLDLGLAVRLLEAVPDTARIILLGDKDQLSSVESGAVFAEISVDPSLSETCRDDLARSCALPAARIVPPVPLYASALRDCVIWFTQNFRFAADSGIGRLAADINQQRSADAIAWLRAGADDSTRWLESNGEEPDAQTLLALSRGFAPYLQAIEEDPTDLGAVAAAFGAFRVLCAHVEGRRGVEAVNDHLSRLSRQALARVQQRCRIPANSPWFVGRPVIVLRNDHVLKLFNGDIGIALPDSAGQLLVHFPDAAAGFRSFAPIRLPEHQTAFAMSVHKSQGSEFDEVLVLLPAQHSRVLNRELLYTAVTRARQRVTISASQAVLAASIASSTQRRSGLLARLADCGA